MKSYFTKVKFILLIFLIIFLTFFLFGCSNIFPFKTKFFIGKWILPLKNTYYTIEFKKDGTFITRGRKFCNIGTYIIMNHEKNSALVKINSVSNQFNTTLLVLRYKDALNIKWASYSQIWYSIKSDMGKKIIESTSKIIQNIYELETWDHYYLISFRVLGKKESDLLYELEKPDKIENYGNQKIYYYKTKGEDEEGNIYSYKFYLQDGIIVNIENFLEIKRSNY